MDVTLNISVGKNTQRFGWLKTLSLTGKSNRTISKTNILQTSNRGLTTLVLTSGKVIILNGRSYIQFI